MDTHKILRQRLLRKAGLIKYKPKYTADAMLKLYETEWVKEFEQLMRNRLVMGALRYGRIKDNKLKKTPYDRVTSISKRLTNYSITGNLENLVDIANLCMLEFDQSQHPNKHFATIDEEQRKQHAVTLKEK